MSFLLRRVAAGGDALAVWKDDPLLGRAALFSDRHGAYVGLNGIAVDESGAVIVSLLAAARYVLRIDAPRELKNVDALRALTGGRLVLFESNAFGPGAYGGQVTLARVAGAHMTLRTLVAGLNDPSSGVVADGRVWFVESKYALLTHRKDGDGPVPTGVPFDLQSAELPQD